MLDQSTDRMWYVIGAVIVGAAIIFIANGTLPDIFASISDTFNRQSDSVQEVVESIEPRYGDNLLADYMIYDHNNHNAINTSRYMSDSVIAIDAMSGVAYAGLYIKAEDVGLKPNTEYLLRYRFEKTDGTLVNIGGHRDQVFGKGFRYSINGVLQSRSYSHLNYANEVLLEETDDDVYAVEVYFTTHESLDSAVNMYDGRLSIQPNRGSSIPVKGNMWDLELVEVMY